MFAVAIEKIATKMEVQTINIMSRIGDAIPDFEAVTTKGTIKFSDFAKDTWIVLFSHPADITPVCTTEISGFAERDDEFTALNMGEILRALTTLQVADKHEVALPLNWTAGDKVIIKPPKRLDEIAAIIADTTCKKVDFYLPKKAI